MIPAPLLILAIPLAAAVPAYLLRRWRAVEVAVALAGCALALYLLSLPQGAVLNATLFKIDASQPLTVLGRSLGLHATDRQALTVLFSAAAVLFVLSWRLNEGWSFLPLGLVMLSLLSAGLMVRPFVFAGLALVAAAGVGAVMIQADRIGTSSTGAALRYLTLGVLALPAFLGAGTIIDQAAGITDVCLQAAAYQPAAILLAAGFVLAVGAVPLYTWTHGVASQATPFATAFLASVAGGGITFLCLALAQEFPWFLNSADARAMINTCGVGMILLGGIVGWAQRSFGRLLACGLAVDLGATVLLLGAGSRIGVEAAVFTIAARSVSLGLLAGGISLLRFRAGGDDFDRARGFGRRYPWIPLAVAIGGLSLAGAPGTIGFVSRWLSARAIGAADPEVLMVLFLAAISVGWGILRGLFALLASEPAHALRAPSAQELERADRPISRGAAVTVIAASLATIFLGLAPAVLSELTRSIAAAYTFYR